MASSRLERIGTIYSRITGLLRAGALKFEDKPLWYEVYEAFPPKNEPVSSAPLPNILYPEDILRAKFQKLQEAKETVNLLDSKSKTKCQKFISLYNIEMSEGNLDSNTAFNSALEKFQSLRSSEETIFKSPLSRAESDLASTFQTAQKHKKSQAGETKGVNINVENIFKDS